jgi:serine/threonine protein kinase
MAIETKLLADFEILELIGQGGMGAVYRARQVSLDRIVALKVLAPKIARDSKFKARFIREARVCAKLNHAHIINGIECGEVDGTTFFAMEYVDGMTSKQLLKQHGKLSLEKVARIARQITDALIYVEKNGIVHRDIKPDNIMVTHEGLAKLCDLGLAKISETEDELSSENSEDDKETNPDLTGAGLALGTPYYISPEQARGQKKVDIRADIYCLGGTLYHLFTGTPPFTGKSAIEIMGQHLTETASGICELEPSLPDDWGWILTRMMAKNASDRYSNPKELLQDIDAAMNGQPVKARSFKAKSSCEPPKVGRNTSPKSSKSKIRPNKGNMRVGYESGSSAALRITAKNIKARDPRASVREGHSNNVMIIGGVIAVVLLLVVILALSEEPAKPKPKNTTPTAPVAPRAPR